ncbi:hypothetical protein PGQ11_001948 [Apiospora arundinis]|uniref:F-box domain-containing protein n=1 Tax=Apiospora arundinis TaxID=335852 RepID=A0ABR2JGN5_9PEZI
MKEAARSYLRDILSSTSLFTQEGPSNNLGVKVIHDPFLEVPLELVHCIISDLDLGDLLNLSNASSAINNKLRHDKRSWRRMLDTHILPFYHELEYIDKHENLLQRLDPKTVCVWAHWSTSPERGNTTPFPGITNRRRIWKTCLQFKELHQIHSDPFSFLDDATEKSPDAFRWDDLRYGQQARVGWPHPLLSPGGRYWRLLHSWEDLCGADSYLMNVMWYPDNTLAALCTTPSLEGPDKSRPFARSQVAEIPRGDWIQEIIMHIPAFEASRHGGSSSCKLLPYGVTVVLNSGKELAFGETANGHCVRPLVSVRKEATIVGLCSSSGLVYGQDRPVFYSIMDAIRPPTGKSEQRICQIRLSMPKNDSLAKYLWKADYRDVLGGIRIWKFPGLRLILPKLTLRVPPPLGMEAGRSDAQPVALEALVWATRPEDLSRIRRLSAWIPRDGPTHALSIELEGTEVDDHHAPGPAAPANTVIRTIGAPFDDGISPHFELDINGAEGEYITEIAISSSPAEIHQQGSDAIRVQTNLQCVVWGTPHDKWDKVVQAPDGERLAGLAAVFGKPGWQHILKGLHNIAGLSMVI